MTSRKSRKKHVQLTLDQARKPTGHGGWRPGAGRKTGRTTVAHAEREAFSANQPSHVTLRVVDGIRLRCDDLIELVQQSITNSHKQSFQIIEFNVLENHMHLIVEAVGSEALGRGIQGFKVRLARIVNKYLGRNGKLFSERYHSRPLRTPREVRNALRYVLNNARHHAEELGRELAKNWFDPYSSAAWFDGWATELPRDAAWQLEILDREPPTMKPRSWLLKTGWRKHGPIELDDVPGSERSKKSRRST